MNLQPGNPNLMKKKAMRVNPPATLEAFTNTLGDVVAKRRHRGTAGYVPTPRDPNAVPSPAINIWAQPVYTPPKQEYVRPGAEDFLRCKSRGM